MRYIQEGGGSLDQLQLVLEFDNETMKLWLQSLVSMSYLTKKEIDDDEYFVTAKGNEELRFHHGATS